MAEPGDLLTTAQVAAAQGVSVRTVARWVQTERLKAVRKLTGTTGALLFDPADVDALLSPEPTEQSA